MKRSLSSFRVFKRTIQKRKVFYARRIDPATGQVLETVATGKTKRDEAVIWAKEYFDAKREKRVNITLAEIALGFWSPNGEYSQSRKARGYSIGFRHLETCEALTRNHILPTWGKAVIHEITTGQIDRWVLDLHRKGELAPASINKILQAFRSMLDQAVAKGFTGENPAAHVRPLRAAFQERGILTNEEVKRLLTPDVFKDFRHYAINLLAFSTGARMGEIRGLLVENVHPDRIEILHSWEEGHGSKNPKFDSFRDVPIGPKVYAVLRRVIDDTCPASILFYSTPDRPDLPVGKKVIESHLYAAMERVGISPEERRERNVTFHSWRHKLNSLLRSQGIPDMKIRLLTGHRTAGMTDRYTHFTATDFADVLGAQSFIEG